MRCASRSIEWPAPRIVATSLRSSDVSRDVERRRGVDGDGVARCAPARSSRAVAPIHHLVVAVADGAARREGAVEVDAAVGDVAAEGRADGA